MNIYSYRYYCVALCAGDNGPTGRLPRGEKIRDRAATQYRVRDKRYYTRVIVALDTHVTRRAPDETYCGQLRATITITISPRSGLVRRVRRDGLRSGIPEIARARKR